MSRRTLMRHFEAETGLSVSIWRQQLRLLLSMQRLAEGDRVTAVALDMGYQSASAFTAMFHRALGVTPSAVREAAGMRKRRA